MKKNIVDDRVLRNYRKKKNGNKCLEFETIYKKKVIGRTGLGKESPKPETDNQT